MEPTGSRLGRLLLVLAVLRGGAWAPVSGGTQDDAHSLCCDFNITSNKQPRCMVQCVMDRVDLLLYDCDSNEIVYVNNTLNDTKILDDMTSKLKEFGDSVRGELPDIQEKYTKKAILQVRLKCQSDANGSSCEHLEFRLDGQRCLVFDLESGKYHAYNSKCEEMKKEWENNEEINELFKKILKGDAKRWMKVLMKWKKKLEATDAPTTAPATIPSKAMTIIPTSLIIFVGLICLIILSWVLL